ncbi:hypothetical protein CCR75_001743 [Bremia lactucae]|uniref:Uncharacterized protein n=1 Tax=Bremia lactucae TaxID=4779 RepID=A0A976FSR0_BRELC|nr:hypothetical protein CCR75_001743 [Bremia lactucae]
MSSCSQTLAGVGLFIFNGVDLVAGMVLCAYSLYLGINHFAPLWLYIPLLSIGSVLVVASLMSSFGLVFRSCSGCMALSSSVLIWISLAELGLAVVILTQGENIGNFLRKHGHELKLSDAQIATFKCHEGYPAYALLALCLMEALRQRYSTTLHHMRVRRQYQYEMLA